MHAELDWNVSPEAWSAFLARCPGATYFHSPAWYLAQAECHGYLPKPVMVRFETGEEALLPLATRRKFKGMMVEAQSGIEAGYGGLVSPTPLTEAQVEAAYRLVRARFPNLVITGNPHGAFANVPAGLAGTDDHTQAVTLMSPERQRKAMTDSRVKTLKKAAKEGFELEVVQHLTEADVERFFAVYAEHSAAWEYRKWVQEEAYFRALLRHGGHQMVLFLARHEGRLAGFRLLCVQGPIVVALHLARAAAYEKTQVGPFMVAESMAWCHAHGHETLDFMPSGQLDGVKAYKASFGTASLPYRVVSQTSWVGASLETLWRLAKRPQAEQVAS